MNKNLCFMIMAVCTSAASAAESPVQIVKSYMAAWNHHNAQQAADYFSPEGVYYDASVGTPVTGKIAAEQQVIAPFIQGVPDLQWKMVGEPVWNKTTVSFEWVFSGHNTGNWAGSPPTGKAIQFSGVSFIKLKQGKITYQGDYYDSATLSRELK